MGGDEIHFQRSVQVLGPVSEPSEDLRYLIRRFADDRPLPERARLVAKMLAGGEKQAELMAANLCEGAAFSPTVWACPTRWAARSGS